MLVGDVTPGDRVVVVEDVVTTGGSALKAVAAAWNFGLKVVKVLILVDRQEGGKEAVAQEVPEVEAVFTISDLNRQGSDLQLIGIYNNVLIMAR